MTTTLTIREHVEQMSGFDEDAVTKRFGAEFDDLTVTKQLRALAFLDIKRNGAPENDAYKQAMELSLKQVSVGTYFAADEPELDEEHPETEPGKDASQPG